MKNSYLRIVRNKPTDNVSAIYRLDDYGITTVIVNNSTDKHTGSLGYDDLMTWFNVRGTDGTYSYDILTEEEVFLEMI